MSSRGALAVPVEDAVGTVEGDYLGAVGFGRPAARVPPSDALVTHGVATIRAAFRPEALAEVLEAFLALSPERRAGLKFGDLRAGRQQVHLPFSPPFDRLELLGSDGVLAAPVAALLGPDFEVDNVVFVSAWPGAPSQELHRDNAEYGHASVVMPLQTWTKANGPMAMCIGTHTEDNAVAGETLLQSYKGHLAEDARERFAARELVNREVVSLSWGPADIDLFGEAVSGCRGRAGVLVLGIQSIEDAAALGLFVGDELTHVDDLPIQEWFGSAGQMAERELHSVRVERPVEGEDPHAERLLVAAPLDVGDALLYDTRTIHWGMANQADAWRHVLHVQFRSVNAHKRDSSHGGRGASKECRDAPALFQQRLMQLKSKYL